MAATGRRSVDVKCDIKTNTKRIAFLLCTISFLVYRDLPPACASESLQTGIRKHLGHCMACQRMQRDHEKRYVQTRIAATTRKNLIVLLRSSSLLSLSSLSVGGGGGWNMMGAWKDDSKSGVESVVERSNHGSNPGLILNVGIEHCFRTCTGS